MRASLGQDQSLRSGTVSPLSVSTKKRVEGFTPSRSASVRGNTQRATQASARIRTGRFPDHRPSDPNMAEAAAYQYRILEAYSRKATPAAVRVTAPGERENNSAPVCFSSSAMFWLTAGWVTPSDLAARVKFPSSATAMKTLSLKSSSISNPYGGKDTINFRTIPHRNREINKEFYNIFFNFVTYNLVI